MTNRFTTLDHNYINTGGNCMVSIFTAYDRSAKALRYVIVNEEGINVQSMDTVGHEPPEDIDYDEIIIDCFNLEDLNSEPAPLDKQFTEEEFALYKYCQFEFYKKYCRDFKTTIKLQLNELPNELFNELSEDFRDWHRDNCLPVYSDGYRVFANDLYESAKELKYREQLQDVKDFAQWFDYLVYDGAFTDEATAEYLQNATLIVGGRVLQLPLHADMHTLLAEMLAKAIDQW